MVFTMILRLLACLLDIRTKTYRIDVSKMARQNRLVRRDMFIYLT